MYTRVHASEYERAAQVYTKRYYEIQSPSTRCFYTSIVLIFVVIVGGIVWYTYDFTPFNPNATEWCFHVGRQHQPFLASHRGDVSVAPENTLLAFQAAVDKGIYQMLEVDAVLTKDGIVAAFHDYNTDDLLEGPSESVCDLTYAEMRARRFRHTIELRVNGDTRDMKYNDTILNNTLVYVPTVKEVLEYACMRKVGVMIDLKTLDFFGSTRLSLAVLALTREIDPTCFLSFNTSLNLTAHNDTNRVIVVSGFPHNMLRHYRKLVFYAQPNITVPAIMTSYPPGSFITPWLLHPAGWIDRWGKTDGYMVPRNAWENMKARFLEHTQQWPNSMCTCLYDLDESDALQNHNTTYFASIYITDP